MKAVILAGGRGERLKPITDRIPKVMVEVAGHPVLEHNLVHLQKYGIKDFIFSLCYLPGAIVSYFGDGSKLGVKIDYVFEKITHPLGTAGAIRRAKNYLNDTFIVAYGDILRDLDIRKMIKYHRESKALVTLAIYKNLSPIPKSLVEFDKNSRVYKFIERPLIDKKKTRETWSNASFYILEPEIFDFIESGEKSDFGKDIFPKLLKNNKKISAFISNGYFVDIGEIGKLSLARKTFRSNL